MARINFIVPQLWRDRYSGGIWCIFEYASGLISHGHHVTIVPVAPSCRPQWFAKPFGTITNDTMEKRFGRALRSALLVLPGLVQHGRQASKPAIQQFTSSLAYLCLGAFSFPLRLTLYESYVALHAPEAEVNIATSFETARPAALLPGRNFYFAQHYEPYFCNEYPDPNYARFVALHSYTLGLGLIANSSWLGKKLLDELPNATIRVCPNAIDHSIFHDGQRRHCRTRELTVISYGGREAEWKGFREMAKAMAIVRKARPDWNIEWRVFGDCILPPNNDTASYVPLGFLSPLSLRQEYQRADVLLSASWYESFPLFPLEAMACGCAVITTEFGTEDYASNGVTAEIVPARNPEGIAKGLLRLIDDTAYRQQLSAVGQDASKHFTWEQSVNRLEEIIGVRGMEL
jgi:glycosyltransferase involved in cell wall biosynthesis